MWHLLSKVVPSRGELSIFLVEISDCSFASRKKQFICVLAKFTTFETLIRVMRIGFSAWRAALSKLASVWLSVIHNFHAANRRSLPSQESLVWIGKVALIENRYIKLMMGENVKREQNTTYIKPALLCSEAPLTFTFSTAMETSSLRPLGWKMKNST